MARRRPRKPAILVKPRPPDPPDPETQRQRETFDVHIGLKNRHWNVEAVVKRLQAIRTVRGWRLFLREEVERFAREQQARR